MKLQNNSKNSLNQKISYPVKHEINKRYLICNTSLYSTFYFILYICLICIFVYAHAIMTLTAPDILLFAKLFYLESRFVDFVYVYQ